MPEANNPDVVAQRVLEAARKAGFHAVLTQPTVVHIAFADERELKRAQKFKAALNIPSYLFEPAGSITVVVLTYRYYQAIFQYDSLPVRVQIDVRHVEGYLNVNNGEDRDPVRLSKPFAFEHQVKEYRIVIEGRNQYKVYIECIPKPGYSGLATAIKLHYS